MGDVRRRRRATGLVAALLLAAVNLGAGPGPSALASDRTSAPAPRLVIDRIGVDAGILPVGLKANGSLAVAGSVRNVYRWKQGSTPGELGSTVLAGHTWSKGDGVFDRLGELRKGDRISVGEDHFTVTRKQVVTKLSAKQVAALHSDTGKSRLVLITCGDRNNTTGVYRTRILVHATLD